jgi:hypothetical protein
MQFTDGLLSFWSMNIGSFLFSSTMIGVSMLAAFLMFRRDPFLGLLLSRV